MNSWITRILIGIMALMISTVSMRPWCFAASSESQATAKELAAIGEPGPQAVTFRMWTKKEEGEAFRPGDRAIIFLSAERKAYLTILSISSDGSITVVLPNKLMPENIIQANKLYALFGDDSPVRLTTGEKSSKGQLVIYLSTTPLTLDPLRLPEGAGWLTIAGDAQQEIRILKEKLRAMAKEEGFNRATLSLPCDTGDTLGIKLTEVPRTAKSKGIPGGVESSIPETVTGSAGLKPLRKGNLKQ